MNHVDLTPGTIVTIPGEYLAVVQFVTPTWPRLARVAVAETPGQSYDEITISVTAVELALCWACNQPADGRTSAPSHAPVCAAHATDGWERLNGADSFPPARTEHAGSPVDETLSNLIGLADEFRKAANAADHVHTVEHYGHAYGDAHTALLNLLHRAYGNDAFEVFDVMVDSFVSHAEAAAYVATQHAAETPAAVTVDPITFNLDHSRYGSRLENPFDVPFILPESVVALDCPDCGTPTTYNRAEGCFDRCNCGDTELMPVDISTDLPWFVGEDGVLRMAEVVYGECRNTDWGDSDGMECGNELTRDDAINGHTECWTCRPTPEWNAA